MPKAHIDNHIILFYGKGAAALMGEPSVSMYGDDPKKYEESFDMPKIKGAALVNGYTVENDPENIPEGSIAYFPVFGEIRYKSNWYFSTHKFMDQLASAEENPSIECHLIHIDSPGGEAFGCHEMFEAVKNCKKPVYCLIDRMACSAGYYIAAACDKIYASSMFSEIGCIGTMALVVNDDKAYEKWGYKIHEYYSKYSSLKNKVFNDAADGNGDDYIARFLDPMADCFINDVKSTRPDLSEDAAKGETFQSPQAMEAGLIDGEMSFDMLIEEIATDIAKRASQNTPPVNINNIEL